MLVRYSKHLETRLTMRGISSEMPRIVFSRASRRFLDTLTGLEIAVRRMRYFGKPRDMMIAYRRTNGVVLLVTMHPLKAGQLENRIRSGRWKPL